MGWPDTKPVPIRRMIIDPPQRNSHLVSAWMAGVALAMCLVGAYGAMQPLLPRPDSPLEQPATGEEVMLEKFIPPETSAAEKSAEEEPVEEPDLEIPPPPVIMAPLAPPEMTELAPLDTPPPPVVKAPPPKSKPPTPRTGVKTTDTHGASKTGNEGGSGAVTTFTGGGGGHFPSPEYPNFAKSAHQQGSVRLLVTVEANGTPSSVVVQTSSGFPLLDSAARDQVSRRWRWPSGAVRRYIVPVRFSLQ